MDEAEVNESTENETDSGGTTTEHEGGAPVGAAQRGQRPERPVGRGCVDAVECGQLLGELGPGGGRGMFG